MPDYLAVFNSGALSKVHNRYIAKELIQLNDRISEHGIVLSQKDCTEIAECRSELLVENERIEIGTGAVERIITEFADSGYVNQQNFKDTVQGLLECFYTIKTETEDRINDDDVLKFLKYLFETEAGGDVAKLYTSDAFDLYISNGKYPPKTSDDIEYDYDTDR